MNKTYIFPIEQQNLAEELSRLSGRIYSKVVSTSYKIHKKKNIWLSLNNMQKYIRLYSCDFKMLGQTKQGIVEQYYINLRVYFNTKKKKEQARPPYRTMIYNKIIYKKRSIKLKNNILKFSNGRNNSCFTIKTNRLTKRPKYAEIIYHPKEKVYKLHAVIEISNEQISHNNKKTLAIDLGQIHPMVTFDGKQSLIYNGGKLNSFIRFRNKEIGKLDSKLSKCKINSKRYKKLKKAKQELLLKSKNKINDVLQKYTSHLISYCIKNKISVIAIGNITGIRNAKTTTNPKINQKLSHWLFRRLSNIIEYKAKSVKIKVGYQEESYTSQTCPKCNKRHKPYNRNYKCQCSFEYHRDSVGAINIWRKYTRGSLDKSSRLEGELMPPYGIRYKSNFTRCQIKWNARPF